MRRLHRGIGIAAGVCAALLVAACSQPAEQTGGNGGNGGDGANGEAEENGGAEEPTSLSIATGTTSGIYFPVGGAMAEIITQESDELQASAEATGASVENMRLLDGGQSDLVLAQGDVVYQAFNGEGEFADEPIDSQVLMVLYPNVYHAVSLQSIHDQLGLDCFSDVEGHRFSVGAPGSGNELATNLVFEALGLSPDSDISRQRLAYAETARALREGQLDAGSWVVGEGHGTLRELEATDPIHLIPICEDELDPVIDEFPFYIPHTISADVYETVAEDVSTISLWNVVAVSPDMSEDRAYELASLLYGNVDDVTAVYEAGAEYMVLDTLVNSPVPLHPGLVRYAEEQGFTVPDELVP